MPHKLASPTRTSGTTSWCGTAPALPAFEPLAENAAVDDVVIAAVEGIAEKEKIDRDFTRLRCLGEGTRDQFA